MFFGVSVTQWLVCLRFTHYLLVYQTWIPESRSFLQQVFGIWGLLFSLFQGWAAKCSFYLFSCLELSTAALSASMVGGECLHRGKGGHMPWRPERFLSRGFAQNLTALGEKRKNNVYAGLPHHFSPQSVGDGSVKGFWFWLSVWQTVVANLGVDRLLSNPHVAILS